MEKYILFGILSLPVIIISRHSLLNVKNHGFYRFFSWECILFLVSFNYSFWFIDPFSIYQLVSWIFLIISAYLVITGVMLMKKLGKPGSKRNEKELYQFEKTTELVDQGIFKFIRHPLYSSLLFLTWGIYLKNPSLIFLPLALLSSLFLYITAKYDEKECIHFFGNKYREYKKRSKMFIPFIF